MAAMYLNALKLSQHSLPELLCWAKVYTTQPNVFSCYYLILCHCSQELRLDVETANRSFHAFVLADERGNGIQQCIKASGDIASWQILILMAKAVKLVLSCYGDRRGLHIEQLYVSCK